MPIFQTVLDKNNKMITIRLIEIRSQLTWTVPSSTKKQDGLIVLELPLNWTMDAASQEVNLCVKAEHHLAKP